MRHLILFLAVLHFISCGENKRQESTTSQDTIISEQVQPIQNKLEQNADTVGVPEKTSAEQHVLAIRREYQRINALKLVPKKYNFYCDTEGTITYFSDSGKVVKVGIDWGFLGDGYSSTEYYFKDNELIFIYEVFVGGPANGPDTRNEHRTYVRNNKTVRYTENQKITACKYCFFSSSSVEYKVLDAFKSGNVKDILCN